MSGIVLQPEESRIDRIVRSIIELGQGRLNCKGQITLTANATTTVVTRANSPAAVNVGMDCFVGLSPRSAHAAAAEATTYISDVGQGTFTITHANSAQTDRVFDWIAIG